MKRTPRACPRCGSRDVIPILYGYPLPETMEAAERGEIELGGCCVTGNDPTLKCRACGEEFGGRRRRTQPVRSRVGPFHGG
jgi:DNA-directed RNA polymerase subunit RPC12/RpoP